MSRIQANFMLIAVAALWGTGNVAQQTILEYMGPLLANGLKCAFAIPVLLPLLLKAEASAIPLDGRGWLLALMTMASYALGTTGFQVGFAFTSVSNAGFMANTATVLTPILSWWILKERPSRCIFLAAVTTLAGVFFIGGGTLSGLNAGDLICLGTAFCFAIWMIALGEFVQLYGRMGLVTLLQFLTTALLCIGGSFATEPISASAIVSALPLLLFLGVLGTGLAAWLQGHAQRHTSATEAAVLISAEAIFGAVAAHFFLNERLGTLALLGASLVMAGIFIVQLFPHGFRTAMSGLTRASSRTEESRIQRSPGDAAEPFPSRRPHSGEHSSRALQHGEVDHLAFDAPGAAFARGGDDLLGPCDLPFGRREGDSDGRNLPGVNGQFAAEAQFRGMAGIALDSCSVIERG